MSLDIADRMVVMGMSANSMTARAGRKSHKNTPHVPCLGQGVNQKKAKSLTRNLPFPTDRMGLPWI